MERSFRHHGMNVETHHVYMDLIHTEKPFINDSGQDRFVETIRGYKPDILLINDDLAFHYILNNEDILLKTIPSVFAGVSAFSYGSS